MKTESAIQKEIIDYLKLRNALVFRLNAASMSSRIKPCPPGTPDILAITYNGVLWVEVKTEKGKLRPSQEKMHAELQERGQRVIIARCLDDVIGEI